MEIQKHILSILQLYEFSMALGKSLDFNEVCNDFLKLVLKRKGLNAAWVLDVDREEEAGFFKFSLPKTKIKKIKLDEELLVKLKYQQNQASNILDGALKQIIPIDLKSGFLISFELSEKRYLFLYAKQNAFTKLEYNQLKPVMQKFSVTLDACDAHQYQKELLAKLELQNKELSEYAHMVSHDLKSPLRSIDALTAWLKEDHEKDLGKEGVEKIELVRNNVAKMDALVGGILDYSTVGKNKKITTEINLNTMVNDLMNFIEIPNHINVELVDTLPNFNGDKHRIQQLFQNLIVNAIANNDKEKGWVKVGYNSKNQFYYIKDNGKGIEKSYLKKIFKAFFKLENNPSSVGLGLSIVKKIVEVYNGKVWVESEISKGTTFYFTLKEN